MKFYKHSMEEFSRIIDLTKDKEFKVEISKEECEALAKRFEWESIENLKGEFELKAPKDKPDAMLLKGHIEAKIFTGYSEVDVKEDIELYIVESKNDLELLDILEDAEVAEEGKLNIGEVMAQYLYLAIEG